MDGGEWGLGMLISLVRCSIPMVCCILLNMGDWGSAPATDSRRCSVNAVLPKLPRTNEDSIVVCFELDYQYLWVVRYCMLQNDQAERHRQLQMMGKIYAKSTLTIVACTRQDPRHGLLGVTQLRHNLPRVYLEGSRYLQMIPNVLDVPCDSTLTCTPVLHRRSTPPGESEGRELRVAGTFREQTI